MCRTLVTHLGCGHDIRGPLIPCPAAIATAPFSTRHGDVVFVRCSQEEDFEIYQATSCEQCFSDLFLGFLNYLCRPCRRAAVQRMGDDLTSMLERASSFSPSSTSASGLTLQHRRQPHRESNLPQNEDREEDSYADSVYHWPELEDVDSRPGQ